MAQQTIDPNQLSDIELKAHVYDMIVQTEMLNRNIGSLNQIIAQRAQARMAASQAVAKTPEESERVASPVVQASSVDDYEVLPAE